MVLEYKFFNNLYMKDLISRDVIVCSRHP